MHGRLFLGGKSHIIVGVYFLVGFLRGILTNHDMQLTLQLPSRIQSPPDCEKTDG